MKKASLHFLFITTIIFTFIAVLTVLGFIGGYRTFILSSGSMEPLYPKGHLVLIDTTVKAKDIAIGDVIACRSNSNDLILHRLIESNADKSVCLTKGDRNTSTEQINLNTNLVGKMVTILPMSQMLIFLFCQHKWIAIVIVLLLLIIAFFSLAKEKNMQWANSHFSKA